MIRKHTRQPEEDDGEVAIHCDVPGLVDKVILLVRSETDVDKRRLLDQYPELLSDESDAVLDQMETALRERGIVQDANNIDGLRYKLGRTKLYGFEHACLEQIVLTAFVNMPDDNPGGYLAQVASRYPELLQPGVDEAIAAVKRDLASGEGNVMGVFLDVLAEQIQKQRNRNAAMEKGNRTPQRVPENPGLVVQEVEEEEDDSEDEDGDGFDEVVEAADPKQWSLSKKEFRSLIQRIKSVRSMRDIQKISQSYAAAREPAFLEWLCLVSSDGPQLVRETARVLWMAAEATTRPEPPKPLRSDYKAFERSFPGNGMLPTGQGLDRAIEIGQKLVAHQAFDSGDEFFRLSVLRRTGEALFGRYQSVNEGKDLDDAIHLMSEATSASRTGSPSFTRASTYGGLALLMRYEIKRERSDLETAALVLRYAVGNHANHLPPLLAQSGMGMVRVCNYQFEAGGGIECLSEAAEIFLYTLAQTAEELDESLLLQVMVPFGKLLTHLNDSGEEDALESLIGKVEQITGQTPQLRSQPYYLYQLAEALNGIHKRNGNLAILNRSITYLSNAAALGGPILTSILDQLGIAYKMRFYATGDKADIERSVESHRRGVELLSTESPAFPYQLDHYSQALRESFSVDEDPSRLDRAVEMAERALKLVKVNDPERVTVEGNLANHLQSRGRQLDQVEDLDRSLSIAEEALARPLGERDKAFLSQVRFGALLSRFDMTGDESNIAALKIAWANMKTEDTTASDQFRRADSWCRLLFKKGHFEDAMDGFEVAKRAARELIFVSETTTEGKRSWIRSYQWLVLIAAYSLARLERPADAVCEIEAGMALLLQEASWTRPGMLERLSEAGFTDLRDRIEKATEQIRYMSGAGASTFSEIRAARMKYQQALAELQDIPGFEAIQQKLSIEQLTTVLPEGTVACYPLATRHGALVLLADRHGCKPLWCERFNEAKAGSLNYGEGGIRKKRDRDELRLDEVGGWIGTYTRWQNALSSHDSREVLHWSVEWQKQLDQTIRAIHDELVGGLSAAVHQRDGRRIVLIPLMTLSWWPLHAGLGIVNGDEIVFPQDSIASSYVPSVLTSLELTPKYKQAGRRSILAIGITGETDQPTLEDAASEAELVAEGFAQATVLLNEQATAEAFTAASAEADIWHFAGHASFPNENEAALVFAGGTRLSFNEIREMSPNPPTLVVLSACESAVFDKQLANERRSLAVAFLELGASHVVATLWPVDDRASLLFMSFFYDQLRTVPAIDALAKTQWWMSGTTDGEKKAWMRVLLKNVTGTNARSGLLRLYQDLALRDGAGRHFSASYFWAGYQILGMGTSLI
jgi:CHAT domain-containing protein/tetratricopeptide (TPR) repeat protein